MKPKIRTVGCLMFYQDRFLIVLRNKKISEGNKWGIPAGKVKENEDDISTILREIKEETGYQAKKEQLNFVCDWTWKFPEKIVEFPAYKIILKKQIPVKLNPEEHSGFKWVTPKECYSLKNLVPGFHKFLERLGYIEK